VAGQHETNASVPFDSLHQRDVLLAWNAEDNLDPFVHQTFDDEIGGVPASLRNLGKRRFRIHLGFRFGGGIEFRGSRVFQCSSSYAPCGTGNPCSASTPNAPDNTLQCLGNGDAPVPSDTKDGDRHSMIAIIHYVYCRLVSQ
jgi:hypothetical protein